MYRNDCETTIYFFNKVYLFLMQLVTDTTFLYILINLNNKKLLWKNILILQNSSNQKLPMKWYIDNRYSQWNI